MTDLSWPSEACHCAPWVEIGRWCTSIGLLQPSRGYDRAAVWRNSCNIKGELQSYTLFRIGYTIAGVNAFLAALSLDLFDLFTCHHNNNS